MLAADEEDRSRRSRVWWLVAAILALALLTLGVVLAFAPAGTPPVVAPGSTFSPSPTTTSSTPPITTPPPITTTPPPTTTTPPPVTTTPPPITISPTVSVGIDNSPAPTVPSVLAPIPGGEAGIRL